MNYPCLTLTTDYGFAGGFVGVLHAVAFRINPSVAVIDVDHNIAAHDVRLGALRLERFMAFAPAGVHVGVVDPGVGGTRRAVAIVAGDHVFVAPDNGLAVWAAEACADPSRIRAFALDNDDYWLPRRSATFDGRDIFVPVAAHLAAGVDPAAAGTEIPSTSLSRLDRPYTNVGEATAEMEVVQVDGFGNIQLSGDRATATALGLADGEQVDVVAGTARVAACFGDTFGDVPVGHCVVLVDSDGMLALSVNQGRASDLLGVSPGARVSLARG